jgi:hypothetical protein
MTPLSFKRHRLPPTIIRHCVWRYARFTLSCREIEEMLAERGVDVSCETVRWWFLKASPALSHPAQRNAFSPPTSPPTLHFTTSVTCSVAQRQGPLDRFVRDVGISVSARVSKPKPASRPRAIFDNVTMPSHYLFRDRFGRPANGNDYDYDYGFVLV